MRQTGEPVAPALVELTDELSNDNQPGVRVPSRPLTVVLEGPRSDWQRATLADSSGRFQFTVLPHMRVFVSASKPVGKDSAEIA